MRFSRALVRRPLPLVTLSVLTLLAVNGCADKEPAKTSETGGAVSTATGTPIIIGEYGSTTGLTSTFGTSTDKGIQLAAETINAAGGIDGHPLKIILRDDEGKPDAALTVVKLLISQDKATAILGEVASTRSIAAAPACQAAKVPMISPSSTNPKVTKIGDYIFRVCFIDPFQGTAAAKFASETLKVKRAAIMTDASNDYSTGLTQFFTENFKKNGGQVVIAQNYRAGDLDFKAQLTTIKAANPDILYVPGYYGEVGPIARQAKQVGLNVPLLGGDGWDSEKLVEGAGGPGKALEGSYFTNHYTMSNPDPLTQKFVADFKQKNGSDPDALAAMGFDALGVLADAIKRVGPPSDGDYNSDAYRAKLRDAIGATNGYKGATGIITLGPDRNAIKPAVILQVKGKDFKYVTTVAP